MAYKEFLTDKELDKLADERRKLKVKCKRCDHLVIVKGDKALCDYCGHYIFKNSKEEFKYRMKERLKKK